LSDNNEQCLETQSTGFSDSTLIDEPVLRADFRQSDRHPGRLVEVGFIANFEPREFAIHFEDFPLWLLALERNFCTKLHVLGWESPGSLRRHLEQIKAPVTLAHRAFSHLGLGRIQYHGGLVAPRGVLVLVSGSNKFLTQAQHLFSGSQTLFVNSSHWKGKSSVSGPAKSRLTHQSFGGPTRFVTLFGSHGVEANPVGTQLRRCVGHVFDHGLRPEPVDSSDPATHPLAVSLDWVLHPEALHVDILHPTTYYASGWGLRGLTPDELGIAFGFPAWLRSGGLKATDFPIVPIQVLDACLKSVLDTRPFVSPLIPVETPVVPEAESATWLPSLQKFLPNSWIDESTISAKAAKNDDSAVPTAMWDQRITLLFEWEQEKGVNMLGCFRRNLMRSYRRRMMADFRYFMKETHGPCWPYRLDSCRAKRALIYASDAAAAEAVSAKAEMGAPPGRGRKRQRGGEIWSEKNEKVKKVSPFTTLDPMVTRTDATMEDMCLDDRELLKDADVGEDILLKAVGSDWWNWASGSTLIFWRWPKGFQRRCARDGMPAWIQGPLPNFRTRAKQPKREDAVLLTPKFLKILKRRYVIVPRTSDEIKSLVDYFYVPKASDIRPVYNGASCGLNVSLWAPNFWLPIGRSALRVLDFGYFSVDIDLGEFFLNFPFPELLRYYSGIDLTPFADLLMEMGFRLVRDKNGRFVVRWDRCWMGCKPSPFFAVRFYYWAEEFARGEHSDPKNALRWDCIKLNLPGDPAYNPTKPRVMKWDDILQKIAGDILGFVDDLRASGYSTEAAWAVARQVASRLQYLGIQDAPRKRRAPSQTPGAWAGAVFATKDGKVTKSISQEKWDKARAMIQELIDEADGDPSHEFGYKRLEQIRGFLCHLAMTYDNITPFLKGLHLTLASFLPQRDSEGWKMSDRQWLKKLDEKLTEGKISKDEADEAVEQERLAQVPETEWLTYVVNQLHEDAISEEEAQSALEHNRKTGDPPPVKIKGVPRLLRDLAAIAAMLSSSTPPLVNVRCAIVFAIIYGFADASGKGFGSTVLGKDGTRYRIGLWDKDTEDETSNFREFENVVESLEEEAAKGSLQGAEIYLCTDNSTVEAALYRGTSSSEKLFALVVRVRTLELKHQARFVVSHVSGKRMMAEGTDGTSRGHFKEGVSIGENMLTFLPWNESAFERTKLLEPWLLAWMPPKTEVLTPEGWFTRGHDQLGGAFDRHGFWQHQIVPGSFIWAPPPAAADVALEELRKARIKRQDSTHFFVCSRLLTPEWLKQLWKTADIIFQVPPGSPGWPVDMFEPLTIGIVFPFLPHRPWQLRGTPKMFHLVRQVRKMFKEEVVDGRDFLRKLLLDCGRFYSMPANVVRRMLFFRSDREFLCQSPRKRGGRKRKRSQRQSKVGSGVGKQEKSA
jgi:hypothetical protein